MKHTWWNWHALLDCLLENRAHSRHIIQIGTYFTLRNNWHIDVLWNILLNIFFFFCLTHSFDIELYDILYTCSILCKLYILQLGVLDWHIHCARVCYEIIKIVEHSLNFHLRSCKRFDEVVPGKVFSPIQDFVMKFWNLHYFHILGRCIYLFSKNCIDYWIVYNFFLADFVLFLAFVDDTPWWKISIK